MLCELHAYLTHIFVYIDIILQEAITADIRLQYAVVFISLIGFPAKTVQKIKASVQNNSLTFTMEL